MKGNRQKATDYLISFLNTLDPSKENSERYLKLFNSMSDKQFDQFVKDLESKKKKLFIYSPNLKNSITLDTIKAAMVKIKAKYFERIYLKDISTGKTFLTPHPYLILQLPIRRVKQFLMDKLSVPDSDKRIDLLSGQVVKPDKGASISLIEMQSIAAKGLESSVIELLKVRGGDTHAYSEFKSSILETGKVNLSTLSTNSLPRSTVVLSTLLKAAHLDNNIAESA